MSVPSKKVITRIALPTRISLYSLTAFGPPCSRTCCRHPGYTRDHATKSSFPPGFLQIECVLRAFENLSDLSRMMYYSLAPGSCSNVLRSRCLLRRFSMFVPSISTTLPGKKESNSTSSVRSRKFPSRTSSIYLVGDPTPTV